MLGKRHKREPFLSSHVLTQGAERSGSAATTPSTRFSLWSAGQSWPWGQFPPAHPIFCHGHTIGESGSESKCHYSTSKAQQMNLLTAPSHTPQRQVLVSIQDITWTLYPAPLIQKPLPKPCSLYGVALSRSVFTRHLVTEEMTSSHMQHLAKKERNGEIHPENCQFAM